VRVKQGVIINDGSIAIAVGAMIDGAIVMIENMAQTYSVLT